jgi:hypothetical protein
MDVAQELEQKYPEIFDPLIQAYRNSRTGGKVQARQHKIIENLLGRDGAIIDMYLQGVTLEGIVSHFGISTKEFQNIIRFYDKGSITKFCLTKRSGDQSSAIHDSGLEDLKNQIELLNEVHLGLFDPLVDVGSNISYDDLATFKKIKRLVEALLDKYPKHAEILQLHYEGFTLQEIGDQFGITRERIRQIIKKYEGFYTIAGTQEWCLRELAKLAVSSEGVKVLPSNQDLSAHHPRLEGALKEHFTESGKPGKLSENDRLEIVKNLGYDVIKEVKNHSSWSEERVIYEIRELAKQLGKPDLMPKSKDLDALGRKDLRGAIQRLGGQFKVAQLADLTYQGQTVGEDGRTYWTEERIRDFLYNVADKEGHPGCMPTQAECAKYYHKGSVIVAIFTRNANPKQQTITWPELAKKHGLKYDLSFQPVTLAYIKSFVKDLGESLYNLTPAEIYVLFEQQRINKAGINEYRTRTFDNLVSAIQSGSLPRGEIEKWLDNHPSDLADALLDPENKTVEEAFKKAGKSLVKIDHKNKVENPSDQDYQEDIEQNLPASSAGETLKSLSVTTEILINSSSDQEAIEFLVAKAKAKLWKRCFEDEQAAIAEAQAHEGNVYSEAVRDIFIEEYTRCQQLPLPAGYSFTDDTGAFRDPKLMQRLIAYRVLKEGRVLNLSGTGTGKTLSAVLASRVIGAQITVIACPNSTVEGWRKTITKAFPESNIQVKTWKPIWNRNSNWPCYLVMNHEMFQNRYLHGIKSFIRENAIDFIVIDELHQVKQRDLDEESQRRRLLNGLITDVPVNRPKPRVLGMSATPIINNLQEGKSLIELVSSQTHDDIGTSATVPNCMKLYQKLTTMGFRMMPQFQKSRVPNIYPIDATPYLEDLFALGTRPHPQQVEAVLVKARWPVIKQHLKQKTVVFTEYVKDIVPYLVNQVKKTTEFSVGTYTGNDKYATEAGFTDMLDQFLRGKVEVLIASIRCLGTGVDGLQFVSNNVIFASLPWTNTDYEQAIGRFDREGFVFDSLNIHVPKTYALLSNGEEWSWCQSKLNRLENKRDIAKAAVDGEIPDTNSQLTPAKATQYWMGWLRRISEAGLNEIERKEIRVPLDETNEAEASRRYSTYGDFSTLNARWNNAYSSTTHERLQDNPEEWCFYHTRMDELEAHWQVNPRKECIKHLKVNLPLGSVIGDFGCGQAKLADSLREIHTVHSFDHVAINRSVIACDMSHVPLEDSTLDAAVFSLSLMGINLKDYVIEAYRTLKPGGQLLIYHPAKANDREKFVKGLTQLGFAIVQSTEVYKWHYIWAIKQGQQENSQADIQF